MDKFLASISLGEFVAAANARAIAKFFNSENNSALNDVYEEIGADEHRHFSMLKQASSSQARDVPDAIRAVYKGSLLSFEVAQTLESVVERMFVMHTVFEGAAFAYTSALSTYAFDDERYAHVPAVSRAIMIDEARHMSAGFKALKQVRPLIGPEQIELIKGSLKRHIDMLSLLPDLANIGGTQISTKLLQLYHENIQSNMKRAFA